jgi:hypothetical protein
MKNTTTKSSDLHTRKQDIRTARHCVFNFSQYIEQQKTPK